MLGFTTDELVPGADDATSLVVQLEQEYTAAEIEQSATRWFDTV